jgi:hypothetical protein
LRARHIFDVTIHATTQQLTIICVVPYFIHSQEKSFLKELARSKGGALWLGEHHNSASDHDLQAEIIRKLYQSRKGKAGTPTMGIGLEQVQVQVRTGDAPHVFRTTALRVRHISM